MAPNPRETMMKEYRSSTGERRLWFELGEIEDKVSDELLRAGKLPDAESPIVDLEEFLEFGLQVKLDIYARLDPDVLGVTEFRRGLNPLVSVNADLTSEMENTPYSLGLRGRWRATLAHEAAHVILYRGLLDVPSEQGELFKFDAKSSPGLFRCLARDVSFGISNSDWKEVQANMGMAALLMPSDVFSEVLGVVGAKASDGQQINIPGPQTTEYKNLVFELSRRFEVSQQAAGIRLTTLGFEHGATTPLSSLEPR